MSLGDKDVNRVVTGAGKADSNRKVLPGTKLS